MKETKLKRTLNSIADGVKLFAGIIAISLGELLYGNEFLEMQDFDYEIEASNYDPSRRM